jgi:hypothetical protein
MPQSIETIRLQLAMAFGQGTGVMIASHEALSHLLSGNSGLIDRAAANWDASHWAFVELTRLLGQLAASHAAASHSAVIRPQDIDACIQVMIDLCPCDDVARGGAPRQPMF